MTRILAVDDKQENLYLLQALLGSQGWETETARHGAEALAKARAGRPDLVISDLLMPVMDGYTLLRHWKGDDALQEVPFVVHTATYTDPEDEQLALDLGADAFILKPVVEPEAFLARMRGVLAGGVRARPPTRSTSAAQDIEQSYSQTLVRKLEQKSLLLEEANRALRRDIVERLRTEELLRESEERFRLLGKVTHDAIWDWDLLSGRLWWNEGFEALFGYAREERDSPLESWTHRIHPDDQAAVVADVKRAIASGASAWTGEYRFRRKTDTYAYVLNRSHVIRDAEGAPVRVIGGMTDLSVRKAHEEQLAEQAALLDAAHEAIYTVDVADRILYWSKGAERTYGWPAAQAVGRESGALLLRGDAARLQHARDRAQLFEAGEWSGEATRYARGGEALTVEVRWTLIRDVAGRPKSSLAIESDVTERRRLEQQLLRVQRLESLGALAGGVAHDINNVLAPILLASDLLAEDEADPARRDMLATIGERAQHGVGLLKQILSFARGAQGRRQRLSVSQVARDVRRLVGDALPNQIRFELHAADDLWPVSGDPTQLQQVLMNLCVNARDAMLEGGRLTVSLENAVVEEGGSAGRYVLVRVEDEGGGIPREIQARVFDPLFTTKGVGQGTGLGLTTVQSIVRAHGGFIRLQSEAGAGTTFSVYLPAAEDEGVPESAQPEAELLPRGRGELVLVVDDEEVIRELTREILEKNGYRVLLASDGTQALTLYARRRDEIAVVLIDMVMPVLDGPATVRGLIAEDPSVRVVVSSGSGVTSSLVSGARHFVPKPYTLAALLRAIRGALDEGRAGPTAPPTGADEDDLARRSRR